MEEQERQNPLAEEQIKEGEAVEKTESGKSQHHHHHSSHGGHSSSHRTHHSSHGRHRHHSSRRSKKNRGKQASESLKNFLKDNKKVLIYAAITLAALMMLILAGLLLDRGLLANPDVGEEGNNPTVNTTVGELQIKAPLFSGEVSLAGTAITAWLNADMDVSVAEIYKKYHGATTRLDYAHPATLYCEVTGIPRGEAVEQVEFLIADNEEMLDAQSYIKGGANKVTLDVYNLMTGTRYYFSIKLNFSSGAASTVGGSFTTAEGPRIMNIGGVRNVRDIGGWKTVDGRTIKQGLLYRGRELDGAVEPTYLINSEGVDTMLTQLGIKTEMDLRRPAENPYNLNALGLGVEHIYYSVAMYSNIFDGAENAQKIRDVFKDLADESKYPVYLHCTYGQDRTGTICYLLGALLGMSEEDLEKEYALSGLTYGSVLTDMFDAFTARVASLPGDTLSEQVEEYLLSIGVTEAEIACIYNIYLGE